MFHIKKGTEPKELSRHRNDGGTYYDFSLDKGKREVKIQLLKEQDSLCAYCTASINFDNMKIEHWLPQNNSEFPEYKKYELQYGNMLAVCQGCTMYNGEKLFHCDHSRSKGEKVIELNPLKQSHIEQLSYTKSTGFLKSSNPTHQKELDEFLNLNIIPFKRARKTILQTFKIRINKRYPSKTANYQKELTKWEKKNLPFSSIVIWYLKSKVKQ